MKIFLTGSTGFIGSHFVKSCIQSGHCVLALKRPNSLPRIKLDHDPIWIDGELDGEYENLFKDVDVFVHLAAHSANTPYDKLQECLYWNTYAPIKLAEQARIQGVKKFLIVGSCFEYGHTADEKKCLEPGDSFKPYLSYPTSKAAASIAFEGFCREFNLKLKNIKLFQVYGEGESESRFWPSLKRAAISGLDFEMSDGMQIRDFTSVAEVVHELIAQLNFSDTATGEPYVTHCSVGRIMTLKDFANECWIRFSAKGKLLIGAIKNSRVQSERIVSCQKK